MLVSFNSRRLERRQLPRSEDLPNPAECSSVNGHGAALTAALLQMYVCMSHWKPASVAEDIVSRFPLHIPHGSAERREREERKRGKRPVSNIF